MSPEGEPGKKGVPGKPAKRADERGGTGGEGGVGGVGTEGQRGGVGGEGGVGGVPGGTGGRGGVGGMPGGIGGEGGIGGIGGVATVISRRPGTFVYVAMMASLAVILFLFNARIDRNTRKAARAEAAIIVATQLRTDRAETLRQAVAAADVKLCAQQHATATLFRLFLPVDGASRQHIARLIDLSDCISRALPTVKVKP
jgi:hypothetical protein